MKKKEKIKVLILSNMYPKRNSYYGIFVREQIKSLEKLGVDVIKVVKKERSILGYIFFILKLILYLSFKSYDLVHAHFGFHSALFPAIIRKKALIITFHGSDVFKEVWRNIIYYNAQRFVVNKATHIIAGSEGIKNALVRDLDAEISKITVIGCGVDSAFFKPIKDKHKLRKKLNLPKDKPIVLFVGTLSYLKGVDIIYKSAELLPDVNFVLVGSGNLKTNLLNCIFVGPRPHYEIRLWMNASDLFLLPSRSEGLGIVILEAFSCGLPVVASAVGGIPDLIKDKQNGFIIKTHNSKHYVKVIKKLLLNEQNFDFIKENAREFVKRNYYKVIIAKKIKSLYYDIVQRKN